MSNVIKTFFANLKAKGALPIFISTFLIKFVTFFGSFFLIRILSKNDYGVYSYFENIYGYLYLVAGLGLSNSIFRFVVIANGEEKKCRFYEFSIKTGTIINFNVVLFACILFYKIDFPDPYSNYAYVILGLSLLVPFKYLVDCNLYLHRAMFKPKRYALWSIVASSAYILAKVLGALVFSIKGIVIFSIIAELVLCVVTFFSVKGKYFVNSKDSPVTLTKKEKKESMVFAIEDMITKGLWTILMLNDVFILGKFFTDPNVIANYKAAILIPQTFSLISNAIGLIVGPYFSKLEHEGKIDEVKKLWNKSIIISTILLSILFVFSFFLAKPLIRILCGEQYVEIVPLMRLFLISSLINNAFRYTTANAMTAMGAVKYNIIISLIGLAIQIGLNIVLIPKFGVNGVAYANIISYSTMAILIIICYIIFVSKRKKMNEEVNAD